MAKKAKKKSKRLMFRFWLDQYKPAEAELTAQLEDLRVARKFAPTLRSALRIFIDLKKHRLSSLIAEFPWIEEHYRTKFSQELPGDLRGLLQKQEATLNELILHYKITPKTPEIGAGEDIDVSDGEWTDL